MKNYDLINISEDGRQIKFPGNKLDEADAIRLTTTILQHTSSRHGQTFTLDLEEVKSLDASAARVLAELSNRNRNADSAYLFDFTYFGLETLTEEVAQLLARFPSHFLCFDRLTNVPECVARQFIGTGHALTFDGCSNFTPMALKALAGSGGLLSLGLSNMNIEQANALSNCKGDLLLSAEQLPLDILETLQNGPNLCLAPDYGVQVIPQ